MEDLSRRTFLKGLASLPLISACHVTPVADGGVNYVVIAGSILASLSTALQNLPPSVTAHVPAGLVSTAETAINAAESALTAYSQGVAGNTCGTLESAVQAAVDATLAVIGALQLANVVVAQAVIIGVESAGTIVDAIIAAQCTPPTSSPRAFPRGTAALRGTFAAGAAPLHAPLAWVDLPANMVCPSWQ